MDDSNLSCHIFIILSGPPLMEAAGAFTCPSYELDTLLHALTDKMENRMLAVILTDVN